MDIGFPHIIDLNGYTEKMRKSFLDKTFFLEKTDATVFVDFGCANGQMIEFMFKMFPEYHYYGYDKNLEMIELAKKLKIPNVFFGTNFRQILDIVKEKHKDEKTALILGSVLHEMFYYTPDEVQEVVNWFPHFDYVCIRDMYFEDNNKHESIDITDVWKIANYYLTNKDDSYILTSFLKKYRMNNLRSMYNFLLKYRYKSNWERELQENYFSINMDAITYGRKIIFREHFLLPFLKKQVKKDFNIDLNRNTHFKLILGKHG